VNDIETGNQDAAMGRRERVGVDEDIAGPFILSRFMPEFGL
jgi:hypothetical protein